MTSQFPESPASEVAGKKAVFKVFIRGPIEKVWNEITKTDEVQLAMFNCRMHTQGLAPDAPFSMRTPNGKLTAVVGKVIEFDPPKRFSHTFRFTHYDDPECIVIYDLESVDGGTNFTLTVDNMPEGTKTAKSMSSGGTMICNTLKSVVENGKPPLMTSFMYFVFGLMAPISPKACKSENWKEYA